MHSRHLGRAAKREQVDAMFPVPDPYTRLTPNPIAWIPDLQHSAFPQHFTKIQRRVRDKRFTSLLNDPKRHVVFSSQCALDHSTSVYGAPKAATYILHFATVPLPSWYDDPAPVVAKYQIATPFFIVCNQFWVHKDHRTLFQGIAQLKKQGVHVNLVCTGPTHDPRLPEHFDNLKAEIKSLGIESQVKILGVIPRTDQISLMRASAAVLQPSQFEGWSTVIEDARALGKGCDRIRFSRTSGAERPGLVLLPHGRSWRFCAGDHSLPAERPRPGLRAVGTRCADSRVRQDVHEYCAFGVRASAKRLARG